jgi:hypothetical protein
MHVATFTLWKSTMKKDAGFRRDWFAQLGGGLSPEETAFGGFTSRTSGLSFYGTFRALIPTSSICGGCLGAMI